MPDSTINLLRDLIAIDSVNPSLVPGAAGEKEIAAAIAAKLGSGAMDVQIQEVVPGRSNVIGVLDSKREGRSLMFCGHMDTVGVAGMDAPFDPAEKSGRVYGRGSQDMKGGLASMMAAALHLFEIDAQALHAGEQKTEFFIKHEQRGLLASPDGGDGKLDGDQRLAGPGRTDNERARTAVDAAAQEPVELGDAARHLAAREIVAIFR